MPWFAKTPENRLLDAFAQRVGGRIYAEAPLAGTSALHIAEWSGSGTRRLDGVRFAQTGEARVVLYDDDPDDYARLIQKSEVWIIEVKRSLTRGVIGQLLVAADLFELQFGRPPSKLIALCGRTDAALAWVCAKRRIDVEVAPIAGPQVDSDQDGD